MEGLADDINAGVYRTTVRACPVPAARGVAARAARAV
jgi:hypothetical protein